MDLHGRRQWKPQEQYNGRHCGTPKKKQRHVMSCANCGVQGHFIKDCTGPVTSFGIIAFRRVTRPHRSSVCREKVYLCDKHQREFPSDYPRDTVQQDSGNIEFLLVQRKDTMAFTDFIRGKYRRDDQQLLNTFISELTCHERKRILTESFDDLWNDLWVNHHSRCYIREYAYAKERFESLANKKQLFDAIPCNWCQPEFGFPKGRKNMRESSLKAAIRETVEETGYPERELCILNSNRFPVLHECFTGTNNIKYQHDYYLAEVNENSGIPEMDPKNIHQSSEIRSVAWMTFSECMRLIRPYDTAKRQVLCQAMDMIQKYIVT